MELIIKIFSKDSSPIGEYLDMHFGGSNNFNYEISCPNGDVLISENDDGEIINRDTLGWIRVMKVDSNKILFQGVK